MTPNLAAPNLAAGLAPARPRLARRQHASASDAAKCRAAFTLLEVILTMIIAGMIVAAIGAALNIHLRVVESGRAEVEQAQLARALLRRIADDLRNAVPVAKQSSSGSSDEIEALASAAAGAASGAGSSGSSGGSSSGGGTGGSGGSSSGGSGGSSGSGSGGGSNSGGSNSSGSSSSAGGSSATAALEELAATDDTVTQPNFYGSQYQMQFDVGRLPDSQQFAGMTSDAALSGAAQAADSLSDVKTVTYFVGAPSSPQTSADPFASADPNVAATNGGLIRTEISRAASSFAYSQGGGASLPNERILAPEVVALQFQYYDGSQWLTDWDSSTTETLPLCVEVLLTLRANSAGGATDPLTLMTTSGDVVEKTYRLLVHLPGSDATASSSTMETESSTSETEATQ